MFTPADQIVNSSLPYLHNTSRRILLLYAFLIVVFAGVILSLPFLYIDISVTAPGVLRPLMERTDLRSSIPGYINAIYYKEGELARKDSVIAALNTDDISSKKSLLKIQLFRNQQSIHDLKLIIRRANSPAFSENQFYTAFFRQQWVAYFQKKAAYLLDVEKAAEELRVARLLFAGKAIAGKELADKLNQYDRLLTAAKGYDEEQLLNWQEQLVHMQSESDEMISAQKQLQVLLNASSLRAPVSGRIQQLSIYQGNFIQAGETICIISPDTSLIAECLLTGKEIVMVKPRQKVLFKFDAFNYSYFGMLTGKILSVDNDYTLVNSRPVFKIKCSIDQERITLKNGFTRQLKKGLTLQATVVLTRRTVWQLLFDKLDDWLNPANHQSFL